MLCIVMRKNCALVFVVVLSVISLQDHVYSVLPPHRDVQTVRPESIRQPVQVKLSC